jgi:hypothetical protein
MPQRFQASNLAYSCRLGVMEHAPAAAATVMEHAAAVDATCNASAAGSQMQMSSQQNAFAVPGCARPGRSNRSSDASPRLASPAEVPSCLQSAIGSEAAILTQAASGAPVIVSSVSTLNTLSPPNEREMQRKERVRQETREQVDALALKLSLYTVQLPATVVYQLCKYRRGACGTLGLHRSLTSPR